MMRDREADMLKLADAFFDHLEREHGCEYGGWGLDDKRPFGNSGVETDILEIITEGEKVATVTCAHCHKETPAEVVDTEYLSGLYSDLGQFLRATWLGFRQG